MAKMNKRDETAFKHFLSAYKIQWDLNSYYRTRHDENLEYYRGWRNPEKYPLAYNMSFNKLLPRIMTILARFMEQLYQGGASNLVSVRPRKRGDVERAPRVEGLLNYQLEGLNDIDEQGGSYAFNFAWLFNAITFGKGICKMYWKREERISPMRIDVPIPQFDERGNVVGIDFRPMIVEMPQMVYDAPYAEVLHNKLFVPHPHYRSIQKMPFVFCTYKRTMDYVKKMVDKGVYMKRSLKDISFNKQSDASGMRSSTGTATDSMEALIKSIQMDSAMTEAELQSDRMTASIDITEGYGRYIFPEDDTPYEVGSGYKIKGKESEAIVHLGNYTSLLKLEKNKEERKPFFDIGCYYHPELYWDLGDHRSRQGCPGAVQQSRQSPISKCHDVGESNVVGEPECRYRSGLSHLEALRSDPGG